MHNNFSWCWLLSEKFHINALPNFIEQFENITPTTDSFDETNKSVLFGYLKNRCIGRTREAIHRSGEIENWESLKVILLRNFGEKKTSTELMDKLKTCRCNRLKFYHYISNFRNQLHNRNLTQNDGDFTIDEINKISLTTF